LRRSVEREAERKRLVALSPKEARFRRLAYRMITEYAFARVDGKITKVDSIQEDDETKQAVLHAALVIDPDIDLADAEVSVLEWSDLSVFN
jgi:hypothetical protein